MLKPTVSIIIPTYNRAHLLPQAISSAMEQTYASIEVVVVNDASTDSTSKLLEDYGQQIVSVTVKHGGLGAARNAGLAQAQGQLLAFLDDDDSLAPESVARRVECLLAQPEIGVVYSDLYVTDENNRLLGRYSQEHGGNMPLGDFYEALLPRNFIPVHAMLWRRSVLEGVGGFPNRQLAEDWECLMKVAETTLFCYLDEPLGYYRMHSGNMTHNHAQMVKGYGIVQSQNIDSPRFARTPAAVRVRVLIRYAAQQWLDGDPELGRKFLKMAWQIQRYNPSVISLTLLFLLDRKIARTLKDLVWQMRRKLRSATTATDYFRGQR